MATRHHGNKSSLSMLRLISFKVQSAKKGRFLKTNMATSLPFQLILPMLTTCAQKSKDFWKPSKPCHVGIHWIALAEYSQMSTHVPGFQSFFRFFASFCIGQIRNWRCICCGSRPGRSQYIVSWSPLNHSD